MVSTWLIDLQDQFILNFVEGDKWKWIWEGLGVTLEITLFAAIIGFAIGVVISIIRSSYDKTQDTARRTFGRFIFKIINGICKIYLTVIRGTPVVVQLLIFYFIILVSTKNGVIVGIVTFGINSGAYVAEIFRAGIMSVESGQMEAGRSLGFNYVQTMWHIIIPQAFKNVLPALVNEFITLLKETSVVGYIALQDITKGAYMIIGRTYSPFMPLIAIALVYLILVMFFTWLVGRLERRLRSSEH